MLYPITVEVLHQVFFSWVMSRKVVIFQKSACVQALIQFQSRNNAIAARNLLQRQADNTKPPLFVDTIGNNGGDESETTGLETPAKEVVNKSNGSALIFLVGYGIGSVVVTGFPEEFQEGDMADTLSRVLEQKVWKIRRSQINNRDQD
ncbi:polypyrimidine tract-binding protein homolog 3 [Tanacetum coccineum]